jgi:hypothetical protein
MPKKATKKKAGKTAPRKTSAKSVKKTAKKKLSVKSTTKKAAKKKVLKKKVAKKAATKKKAVPVIASKAVVLKKKVPLVEPGPPPAGIPPVEEPSTTEVALGVVTHYYSHLGVAVVQIIKGTLRSDSKIHIKGMSTNLTQKVESLEYEHQHVAEASAGQCVGLKVNAHVREHDIVYLVK